MLYESLESLPASRSIRFAASAAKFSILKCLSCPEKQFYQINPVFIISEFGSISKGSGGQNRIPRAVLMLGEDLELTGGASRIELYTNE